MTRTRPALTAITIALTTAACGQTNGVETKPTPFTAPAAAPLCSDAFHNNQPVTLLDDTNPVCTDPDGTQVHLGAWRCDDGTHLVTVDKHTGAPDDGWYQTGPEGVYHADPESMQAGGAYGDAYDKCHGNTP